MTTEFEPEPEFDVDTTAAASEPLSSQLSDLMEKAVQRRLAAEADAIAETSFHEVLTPELYQQLQAAAEHALQAQIAATVAAAEQAPPELVFGSVEEFVAEKLARTYRREVTESKHRHWCPQWWLHEEAISRLEALWRSWEHLRLDPALGMSVWWRDHADHHMAALFDADGPFKSCSVRGGHRDSIPPLPLIAPDPALFLDQREPDTLASG